MKPESAADSQTSPRAPQDSDFTTVATQLRFLTPEAALQITGEAEREREPPLQYAVRKGLLQPGEAEIVEFLMHPAQVLPGYDVLALLGRGGMGVVYRARQRSLGRQVALKTIHLNQLTNRVAVQRFEQEAMSLARLVHPHIVTVYDFGRHEERLYFAMELVEGEDVEQLIRRRGPLPETLVWQLIRQAAAGLAHAAHAGVVHRDVKPANLLLVRPPEGFPLPRGVPLVKIADFGLALLGEDAEGATRLRLTSESVHVGSPIYMAPEQLDSGQVDRRADIFALGATAWHMLAGKPPLAGMSLRQLITLRLTRPTDPVTVERPDASPATRDLVAAMLQPDPADRPSNYEALLDAIDRILGAAPGGEVSSEFVAPGDGAVRIATAETMVIPAEPTRKLLPAPSMRLLRAVAALATLALLVIALLWLFPLSRPQVRELRGSGNIVGLFDGQSLSGWRMLGGEWSPDTDAEGGHVLRGNGFDGEGLIVRSLPGAEDGSPVAHYSLECYLRLETASAAELQFDLASSDPARLVVRVTRDGVTVGTRDADHGELQRTLVPPTPVADKGLTLRLERQRDYWWILVDGRELGVVPLCHAEPWPEFRLAAGQGIVHFADLTMQPLAAEP